MYRRALERATTSTLWPPLPDADDRWPMPMRAAKSTSVQSLSTLFYGNPSSAATIQQILNIIVNDYILHRTHRIQHPTTAINYFHLESSVWRKWREVVGGEYLAIQIW
jgi:hypothetical protein